MSKDALKLHVQALPNQPGVYQFYDDQERIIYVGKAKNLKNRVSSYFRKQVDSRKTQRLVKNISSIKHIVVPTESDALILENTLIKEHQPRYNILLRDDKTYPWICIKKEAFPRVFTTRKIQKDGSEYFGPFTNFKTVRLLMNLIQELYPCETARMICGQNRSNPKTIRCVWNIISETAWVPVWENKMKPTMTIKSERFAPFYAEISARPFGGFKKK